VSENVLLKIFGRMSKLVASVWGISNATHNFQSLVLLGYDENSGHKIEGACNTCVRKEMFRKF
jgi:hypothetical protein